MKKEMTMEVRLLIALVLVGLVLLVSQYFIKPAAAPIATKEGAAKSAQPVTPAAVEKPQEVIPSPARQKAAETSNAVQAASEESVAVDTDLGLPDPPVRPAVPRDHDPGLPGPEDNPRRTDRAEPIKALKEAVELQRS